MAYAVGHISGGHFNPAVTIGLAVGRPVPGATLRPYVVTQVVAAIVGGGRAVRDRHRQVAASTPSASGFATNGYGDRSPGGYSLLAVLLVEVVLTALFLYVILGPPTPGPRRASPRSPSAWRSP